MQQAVAPRQRQHGTEGAGSRWRWPVLLLVGAVVGAYGPAVPNFFVSDDLDMLSGDASDLFSPASGFGRLMPLAASVHRAVAVLFGLNPVPAHALQLALHVACVLLVYLLVLQIATRQGIRRDAPAHGLALTVACLFALYPRHHQVVMWFGAVSIGLAAMLSLATAGLFVRASRGAPGWVGWAAAATYTAALAAHESAVVLPLLLAVLACYEQSGEGTSGPGCTVCSDGRAVGCPSPKTSPEPALAAEGGATPRARGACWRRRGAAALGRRAAVAPPWLWAMALASVTHLGLLAWAYRVRAATYPESGYRFLGLGADLAAAPLRYAAQLVAPPPWTETLALGGVGLALGGAALLGAAWWARRGGALTRLGLAWAAVAAAPFVLFGVYGVTDRYFYLPSAGLALAVAALLQRPRWGRRALLLAYAGASLLLLLLVGGEWQRAGARVRGTMTYLADWAAAPRAATPEAAAFVGVPFKQGEGWPGSQVYVFSTGLVGAAHLATGRPDLRVSYVFADEHPALGNWLATLPAGAGPSGLALFALDEAAPVDRTGALGAALPELTRLRWRGASRTPIDWGRYADAPSGRD